MRRVFLIVIVLSLWTVQALAGDDLSSGGSYFIEGISAFNNGKYADSVNKLESAYWKLPALADYSMLYMAKSHLQTGDTEKAIEVLKNLYAKYPSSPIIEEARGIEVMTVLQENSNDSIKILTKYVADYPSDVDMKFVLAGLLRETGNIEEAKRHFKEIYIAACPLSREARAELETDDLTAGDFLARGTNLIKSRHYEEAEKTLRAALGRGDRNLTKDITEKLALALFSQRKYEEASGFFIEVDDLYNAARSYIRSGKQKEFENAMNKLTRAGDYKGARLMIAYSGELRRDGKTGEALKLLAKVRKIYPEAEEEAFWSIGWIHYLNGDSKKAQKTFEQMYAKYRSPKYLYWEAKALEKSGGDASRLYKELDDDGYYGLLAGLKTGGSLKLQEDAAGLPQLGRMERVDILATAGLRKHAIRELLMMAEQNSDNQSLREIATKLMELQEYRRAILVTSTLPEKTRPPEILYPLAFWPRVTSAASNYNIDPFLLLSLIREESRFDPEALSSAGAIGLMQLMPQTAKTTAQSLNLSVNNPNSLYDADLNIKIGTHYLNILLRQFDSIPAALAAYNAGGQRVKKWLLDGNYESYDEFIEDIPFDETRNYVKRIITSYYRYTLLRSPERTASIDIL